MRGFRVVFPAFLAAALAVPSAANPASAAEDTVISVLSRPGVTVQFRYIAPDAPRAAAVLLEGGSGRVQFDNPNQRGFLVANARSFAAEGIAVALMNAPSDQRDYEGGMRFPFRGGLEHRADINAVLAALNRKSPGAPKWLVGVSAGTLSAVAYAANRAQGIEGVVLLSSIVRPPKRRTDAKISVFSFPIGRIAVPLLAVAHADDGCGSTPPGGAKAIVARATSSRHAEALFVEGGENRGQDPCRPLSHHTFFRNEGAVVAAVAKFIFAHSPR